MSTFLNISQNHSATDTAIRTKLNGYNGHTFLGATLASNIGNLLSGVYNIATQQAAKVLEEEKQPDTTIPDRTNIYTKLNEHIKNFKENPSQDSFKALKEYLSKYSTELASNKTAIEQLDAYKKFNEQII